MRITVNNEEAARAVPEIAARLDDRGLDVPIIGDFHYNGHLLLTRVPAVRRGARQVPHQSRQRRRASATTRTSRRSSGRLEHDKPVRIGVNWGSLDQDLLTQLMDENAASPSPRDAKDV